MNINTYHVFMVWMGKSISKVVFSNEMSFVIIVKDI